MLRHAQSGDEHAELSGARCGVRAAELRDEPLMLAFLTAVPDPLDRQAAVMAAADRLPSHVLHNVAAHATDDDALAAIAVSAAAHDDYHLVLDILPRITSPSRRETALISIAGNARPLWAESLLPSIRELWEGPRAEALAALVPHVAPERRAMLVEEAVRAADGYSHASAPARGRILRNLAAEIPRMPPTQVVRLWDQTMRVTSLRGRDEVLVDLAALAEPLIEVLGPSAALELDDAIQVGATDRWP
jgi:hypothetical protein